MITNEACYGLSSQVPVLADSTLADMKQSTHPPTTFQTTPAGQSELFQVTQRPITVVPWTYVVLSPLSTVTAVADQQLLITSLIVFPVLGIAALIGLLSGQRITRPILRAVDSLLGNSHVLTTLATKQKSVASEQKWVIDSFLDTSLLGLQAMHYHGQNSKLVTRRLSGMAIEVQQRWHLLDAQAAKQASEQIVAATQYIEQATRSQETSKQKVAQAMRIMLLVNEQLVTGVTSAASASTHLKAVRKGLWRRWKSIRRDEKIG